MKKIQQLIFTAALLLTVSQAVWAQGLRITFPAPEQKVRGEIKITWEGVPDGGYAMVRVDGQLKLATAQPEYIINTLPPNFPEDGPHTISIASINQAGRRTGEATVTFHIANKEVDPDAAEVPLTVWKKSDYFLPVQRYRVFAESNGNIDVPTTGGAGGGGGGGAGAGGGGGGEEWIPAPLDWQLSALLRRVLRDVGMVDGAANIRTVVENAFQRQRQSEYGGAAAGGGGATGGGANPARAGKAKSGPTFKRKAPWHYEEGTKHQLWEGAPETGQYFVKMVQPTGEEINATRKPTTIAMADLLPTFPAGPVKPGNTWETTMTFLGELSERKPINVVWRMLFSTFDNVTTPGGAEIRCAKLESRFQLPGDKAKDIAMSLAGKGIGGAGGAGGGGGGAGTGGTEGRGAAPVPGAGTATAGGDSGVDPDSIKNSRTNVSRVLWFDIENRRVIRCEDRLNTSFEMEAAQGGAAGGATGAGTDGAAAPAEPTRVNYNLFVVTQYDDTIPDAQPLYSNGYGTAHRDPTHNPDDPKKQKPNNRDKTLVQEPSLRGKVIPN